MQPRLIASALCLLIASAALFFSASEAKAQNAAAPKQAQEEFFAEVRKNFQQGNFTALDVVADQARESKERFPGGDWKLFVFYQALAWPTLAPTSPELQWKAHLGHFEKWIKASSKSQTARIASANSWVEYAKLARTADRDWREFDKDVGGKEYQKRLKQAHIALDFDTKIFFVNLGREAKGEIRRDPGAKLPSLCPHFYYVKLAMEQGRAFDDWTRYNDIFARAVALEPNYYYFYQIKAFDLMVQNQGVKGQWEAFAENSIKTVAEKAGTAEGDITYYMIVSFVRARYVKPDGRADFFTDNNIWGQKIWDGYKEIEAKYGTNKFRLNEMALLASKAQQFKVAKILFDRIGDDWDERVWERRAEFDGYRNMAKAKAPSAATKLKTDLAELKATLSSPQTNYAKSQGAEIEAVIEYPAGSGEADSAYEVGVVAFSLAIQRTAKGAKEITLLPQVSESQETKRIEQGGSIRLTYKINFALAAGIYKARLKSVQSNELTIKIGGAAKR
ncbi:MAG: hypothetical protein SF097_25375 [Acidobacteriota bacterium]|nr:hypothetical protein [Acidobacteriota bacterium]